MRYMSSAKNVCTYHYGTWTLVVMRDNKEHISAGTNYHVVSIETRALHQPSGLAFTICLRSANICIKNTFPLHCAHGTARAAKSRRDLLHTAFAAAESVRPPNPLSAPWCVPIAQPILVPCRPK